MSPILRKACLKPEHASLYPEVPANIWLGAAGVAARVAARLRRERGPAVTAAIPPVRKARASARRARRPERRRRGQATGRELQQVTAQEFPRHTSAHIGGGEHSKSQEVTRCSCWFQVITQEAIEVLEGGTYFHRKEAWFQEAWRIRGRDDRQESWPEGGQGGVGSRRCCGRSDGSQRSQEKKVD
jgi:hypothetical protein